MSDESVWEFVLTHLPFVRDTHVWDDVSQGLEEVYRSGGSHQVMAAMEYVDLRFKYYQTLEDEGKNLRHINAYEMLSAETWFGKLNDRLNATKRGRATARRGWVPEKAPKVVRHPWLH